MSGIDNSAKSPVQSSIKNLSNLISDSLNDIHTKFDEKELAKSMKRDVSPEVLINKSLNNPINKE